MKTTKKVIFIMALFTSMLCMILMPPLVVAAEENARIKSTFILEELRFTEASGVILVSVVVLSVLILLILLLLTSKQKYYKELDKKNIQVMVALDKAEKATALEKEKMKIAESPFDLEGLLGYISSSCYYKCKEKGISFKVILRGVKEESLMGDQMKISRIIFHLLTTSVQVTEPGGEIELYVTRKERSKKDKLVSLIFQVSHTGCGMSEDDMSKLFSPFENKNVQEYENTGWGMFVTEYLVNIMGGQIVVESERGKSTNFIVELPFAISKEKKRLNLQELQELGVLRTEEETQRGVQIAAQNGEVDDCMSPLNEFGEGYPANEEKYDLKGCRVMLADDREAERDVVVELLEMVDVQVDCASSGEEAVSKFCSSKPGKYDILLLDVNLPRYDGYEVTSIIRQSDHEDARNITILAMTANATTDDMEAFQRAGMDEYISKPIDAGLLYRMLSKYYN